jgi:hypothetical protein
MCFVCVSVLALSNVQQELLLWPGALRVDLLQVRHRVQHLTGPRSRRRALCTLIYFGGREGTNIHASHTYYTVLLINLNTHARYTSVGAALIPKFAV